MRRSLTPSLVGLVVAAAWSLVGCGDGSSSVETAATPTSSEPTASNSTTAASSVDDHQPIDPPDAGPLATWSMVAGECRGCGFTLTLDAGGIATRVGHDATTAVAYDADAFRQLLDGLDPDGLVVDGTDCGREVDGNAPTLTLFRSDGSAAALDTCAVVLDVAHPVVAEVLTLDLATTPGEG